MNFYSTIVIMPRASVEAIKRRLILKLIEKLNMGLSQILLLKTNSKVQKMI